MSCGSGSAVKLIMQDFPVTRVAKPVFAFSTAAFLCLPVFAGAPVLASEVEAHYAISLAGLSVGKAQIKGSLEGTSYTLNVSSALTGIMGAVSKGRGAATSRGNFGSAGVLTNGFSLSATNGTETRTIQITAASGSVRNVVIDPPFVDKSDGGDRIPLRDSHKVGVLDPVSALIMPSRTADPLDKSNCERRIPVFDGSQRFDVILSYSGTRQVRSEKGYSGPVLVCSVRYVPVAGHRPERRAVKFMVENRAMDTWLAPVNGGKVLMPYRISVKTMIGTTVIEAEGFNPG
ncbi:MAG: hypothetical protein CFE31_17190 [Rhizobiales bacterium PAR1]|nr:MAG: hypothetical protein CFE31_17190 [Rhizobiales bacterium PAR1]